MVSLPKVDTVCQVIWKAPGCLLLIGQRPGKKRERGTERKREKTGGGGLARGGALMGPLRPQWNGCQAWFTTTTAVIRPLLMTGLVFCPLARKWEWTRGRGRGAGLGCIARLWGWAFTHCCRRTGGGEMGRGCILMSCTRELLRNFPAGRGVRFVFS